ncbi:MULTISPECIES: LysR family transcriptional regulator [unclassified Sinorhizobium]|uniref:LysR family transcriptional regulator n=1 Tax=unclassified Sinorhizobium TaxID=2613772 RepID=UPI00352589B5
MTAIPDLEPDLLRAFVAVAETGSFTAAAEVIGRSQSAVSQKVLRLEDILQMRVFDRTSRSLSLTRDGERLLVAGKRLLAHYENFMQELRDPPKVSVLRLGISENLVQTQLPRLLSSFSHRYPDVQLELTTATSEELLADYDADRLDIVIAKTRKDGSPHPGRVIWREPLVWLAGPDYRADNRRPARLVMMRPPCIYRAVMTESLDAIGREWVTACTASNLLGIQAAVLGGLGVTVLGKSFAQNGMKVLPPSEHWPALPTAEVSVIGGTPEMQHIVRPLVTLLTESLLESASLTLDTPLAAVNER